MKLRTRSWILVAVWLGSTPLPVLASSPIIGDEEAREVIGRSLEAMGGREAIERLAGLSVEAECTGPRGAFFTQVDSARPDEVRFRQSVDGTLRTEIVVDGSEVWTIDPETGERKAAPEAMRGFARGHEFHLLFLELDRRYAEHRLGALEAVGEEPCRRVEMLQQDGRGASVCVSSKSHLPLVLEMLPPADFGDDPIRVYPKRWRAIEGIRFFEAFELTHGEDTFTYDYRAIRPDFLPAAGG